MKISVFKSHNFVWFVGKKEKWRFGFVSVRLGDVLCGNSLLSVGG